MAGEKMIIHISSLGCSVVDYCLVEKEEFDNFSNFEVTTVSDLERSLNYQLLIIQFSHGCSSVIPSYKMRMTPHPMKKMKASVITIKKSLQIFCKLV